MNKYEVGNRVRIIPLDEFLNCGNRNPEGKMDHWAGKVMTIRKVDGNSHYYMEEDRYETNCNLMPGWRWSERMIDGLVTDEIKINKDDLLSFIAT